VENVPKTKPIAYHQDTSFTDFLDPPAMVTCWVTLDDTYPDVGTLEYAAGSHLWPLTPIPEEFHGQKDYRAHMRAAARAAGVDVPEPAIIKIPAGSCVFHAGEIWHGSGPNTTGDQMRRSIDVHLLPEGVRFSDLPGGCIYRRYQKTGDPSPDESFFPLLWSRSGHRTAWIEAYCDTGWRTASQVHG
jgi:phytanoyl-CoA hydroxylase